MMKTFGKKTQNYPAKAETSLLCICFAEVYKN